MHAYIRTNRADNCGSHSLMHQQSPIYRSAAGSKLFAGGLSESTCYLPRAMFKSPQVRASSQPEIHCSVGDIHYGNVTGLN
jgi:hypothetical protein